MMLVYILVGIIGYLIGSVIISIILSKKIQGYDIRQKGSGSAGSTNVLRNMGAKYALVTFLWDVLKGAIAILLGILIANIANRFGANINACYAGQIAGICAALGHTFPIYFEFKGGKAVATSLGVILVMNWQIGLICLVFALLMMALTRMVSVGSVTAAVLFPVLILFGIGKPFFLVSGNYIIFSILLAVFVIFNHRENIKRILQGKENKLSFGKKA